MPTTVIAAVVGYAVASGAGFVVGTLAFAAVSTLASTAFSLVVGAAFSDKPDSKSAGFEQNLQGNLVTVRQAITHWQWIYGRKRVGGALTFVDVSADNRYLRMVVTFAAHPCEEIEEIWFNDEPLTLNGNGNETGRYLDHLNVIKSLGQEAADVQPFPGLEAETAGRWSMSHRQTGRTKIYFEMVWTPDLWPNGIPNITAVIKGKRDIRDPRTGLTAWTDNASLCQADLLCSPVWLGADYDDEIDEAQLIAAANVDDESVTLASGGTEKRYTLNGVLEVNTDTRDALSRMLTANAGKVHYIGGLFRIMPAAYIAPTITLDEGDLRSVPNIDPRLSASDLANGVKGVYVEPGQFWLPTDFPAVTNATYLAEDQGERSWHELDLPFTTSAARAQRIAKIELERLRQQISVQWPGKFTCFRLQAGDTVQITFAMMGWSAKVFEVIDAGLAIEDDGSGGVRLGSDLALRETASSVFSWNSGEETQIDPAPDTQFPDPFTVGVPGTPAMTEALYETRDGRGVAAKATLSWGAAADAMVQSYRPEYKLASSSVWTVLPHTGQVLVEILDITPGIYNARVKAINALGVSSAYSPTSTKEITGLGADPEPAVILGLQPAGGIAILTLEPHPALDVRRGGRWLVRHSEDSVLWEDSFSIGQDQGYPGDLTILVVPLKAGTYLVKPEDSTGHASAAAATISTKQASVHAFSPIATLTEDSVFSGTHDGTLVASGNLQLTAGGLFDDIPAFDAISSLDAYGGIVSEGTYTFAAGFDFSAVSSRRLTGHIQGETVNVLDSIDSRTANIDEWLNFDGTGGGGSTDAWIEYRETDDDPTGTPTWSEWKRLDAAEVEAWGVQFRLRIVSTDPAYNQYVDALRVVAEEVV